MLFKNPTEITVKIAAGAGMSVAPSAVIDLPDPWCSPRRASNGSRIPSIIEMIAPQLKPANDADRIEWEKAPPPAKVASTLDIMHEALKAGVTKDLIEQLVKETLENEINGRKIKK